jgi:hypothetical protein
MRTAIMVAAIVITIRDIRIRAGVGRVRQP